MIGEVVFSEFPDYGDILEIPKFLELRDAGVFIDYDGFGYFANRTQQSNVSFKPSNIRERLEKYHEYAFTHVIWFNR